MNQKKHQYIIFTLFVTLMLVFYFGFDIRSKEMKLAEKSRVGNLEVTSIENIKRTAFDSLPPTAKAVFDGLQLKLNDAVDNEERTLILKQISGFWYRNRNYAIAGDVAKEIANQENSEEAWAITGTTFASGISNASSNKLKKFNQSQAVKAFENAISMNPENPENHTNLAICYAELPPKENPMKGILMLLDLSKRFPEDAGVSFQLGRLGMQTGQYEKAIGRLEKALTLEPNYKKASCLLAVAYEKVGDIKNANKHKVSCNK